MNTYVITRQVTYTIEMEIDPKDFPEYSENQLKLVAEDWAYNTEIEGWDIQSNNTLDISLIN